MIKFALLIIEIMHTLDLLCSKYLSAKLRFLDSIDRDEQYKRIASEPDPTPEIMRLHDRYSEERWKSYIHMINATGMLLRYVSSCAMESTRTNGYMCYFEGYDLIEDKSHPIFSLGFDFMVIPNVDELDDESPELFEICEQIQYGSVSLSEVKRRLDEAGLPHSGIHCTNRFSDYELMHKGLDKIVLELKRDGMELIEDFLRASRHRSVKY